MRLRRQSPSESGWAVRDALAGLPKRPVPVGIPGWERWWDRQTPNSLAVWFILAAGLSLLLSLGLLHLSWTIFPSLRPSDPGALQSVLWQVDAGLVAVALPVFLVIVQFSSSLHGDIAALPIVEVFRRDTAVVPTLIIAAFGFIRSGVDSIWFISSAVLFVDFLVVFVFTTASLGFSFLRFFQLAGSQSRLQSRAELLLRWKLDKATDALWAITRANEVLIDTLAAINEFRVEYRPYSAGLQPDQWVFLRSRRKLRLDDVRAGDLAKVLKRLPAKPAPVGQTPPSGTAGTSTIETSVFLMRVVGSDMDTASSLIAFRRASFHLLQEDQLSSAIWPLFEVTEL